MLPFGFLKTEYANPGAMNYAFVPNMTLPLHAIGGPASMVLQNLNLLSPNQAITLPTIPLAGFGGLSAGQFVGQPLSE